MMAERWLWDRFLFQVRESSLIAEGGKILDVGTGINTTTLEMFGDKWDVTPSDINVSQWNSHIPGMVVADAEALSASVVAETKWDGIIFSEVLEHVPHPHVALMEAKKILADEGVLIVSTPFLYRIHEYNAMDTETAEPGLKDYWRMTPSGMALLLQEAAFERFWVGRLVEGDKTCSPEWFSPKGVVAWAAKHTIMYPKQTQVVPLASDAFYYNACQLSRIA